MVHATNGSLFLPPPTHTQRGQNMPQLHFNVLFFVLTKSLRILACLHTQKNGNISEHRWRNSVNWCNIRMSVYVYTTTLRQTTCQSQDRWFCFSHIWGGSRSHLDTLRMQHHWRGDCRQDNSWRKDFGVGKCNASRTSGWFTCTHPLIHLLNRSLLI